MTEGPQPNSRHEFCTGVFDDGARLWLTDRAPYGYRAFADNRFHVVADGDTLHALAARYFPGVADAMLVQSPAEFWWVIADFQPDPIVDPTVMPTSGSTLVIPSERTVEQEILALRRRAEF